MQGEADRNPDLLTYPAWWESGCPVLAPDFRSPEGAALVDSAALSGLTERWDLRPQGGALGWHRSAPLGLGEPGLAGQ